MSYFTKQEARNAAQTARNARASRGFGIESVDSHRCKPPIPIYIEPLCSHIMSHHVQTVEPIHNKTNNLKYYIVGNDEWSYFREMQHTD